MDAVRLLHAAWRGPPACRRRCCPSTRRCSTYEKLFGGAGVGRAFISNLLLALGTTLVSTTFNTLAGYAFARLRFRHRDRVFALLLAALVIPGQVAMLPLFLMLRASDS